MENHRLAYLIPWYITSSSYSPGCLCRNKTGKKNIRTLLSRSSNRYYRSLCILTINISEHQPDSVRCSYCRAQSQNESLLPKYLKWNRHEVLQCALILESAMKSFESVAIATVKNFEMSISNSATQCRAEIDFNFRFLGNNYSFFKDC